MSETKRPRAWCPFCMNTKAVTRRGTYWPHNPLGVSMWEGVGWCPGSYQYVIQAMTTYDPDAKPVVDIGTF
ncbi:MAG: hypothetical protein DRH30_00585 [Deltaproteobacteria bacterium]|nr:MAG: hypothetical protein DRH30_00585 [Deltaproteobacteria bacterium]